jgi:hypothetical protein
VGVVQLREITRHLSIETKHVGPETVREAVKCVLPPTPAVNGWGL